MSEFSVSKFLLVNKYQAPNNQFLNRHCYYPNPNKNSLSPDKRYSHEGDSSFALSTPPRKVELPPVKPSVKRVLNRLEDQTKRIEERERLIRKRLNENRFSNSFDDHQDSSFGKSNSGSISQLVGNNYSVIKHSDHDFDIALYDARNSKPTIPSKSKLKSKK